MFIGKIMVNRWLYFFFIAFGAAACFGQAKSQIGYQDLKEYEGNYEYFNNSRLQVAASPKDNLLYAIINEVRYPLKTVAKDSFLDGQNSRVLFERNAANQIVGYRVIDKQSNNFFKLLSKENFPVKMWYPRYDSVGGGRFEYDYEMPEKLNDRLNVGSLQNTGLDTAANLRQDLKMVVVITGGNYNGNSPSDELLARYILPSFGK